MSKKTPYRNLLVFASYNEADNLALLLKSLDSKLTDETLVVIADDSGIEHRTYLEKTCLTSMPLNSRNLAFSYSQIKAGRGSAIRRAFQQSFDENNNLKFFVEADSDGSHSAEDILKILYSESEADLLIGSRYLPDSEIVGWSFSRRTLSKFLNKTIPRLLGINAKDLTNGLRRYNTKANEIMLRNEPRNQGFIYLSEVAKNISDSNLVIQELPIRFEDRVLGESTVGRKELWDSMIGLIKLSLGSSNTLK